MRKIIAWALPAVALALQAAPALAQEAAPEAIPPVEPQQAAQQQSPEKPLPLWELRAGFSSLYAPDYPGSSDSHWNGIGGPVFVYRGERIRIGNDEPNSAARAIAVETQRYELDVSLDAGYSSDSSENARIGMPDLETTLEIGPQLTINLHDSGWTEEGRRRLRVLLPIREVGATDFKNYEHLGYIFQPAITYRRQWPGSPRTSYSTTLASVWATEGVQDYYYQVDPMYATATRAAYDAKGGYLGTHLQISGRREIRPDFHLFLTYRLRSLAGSANDDSPLHQENLTHAFSVSAVWTLFRSDRPAQDGDR